MCTPQEPLEPSMRPSTRPRILLAEDDAEMREVMIESLCKDDHQVIAVADGGQLLVQLTSHYRLHPDPEPIDLIVTDIRMPVVSGLDIVQSLRDANWTTPIVMVTAFADADTRVRARGLRAIVLEKPFKMAALRLTVSGLLWLSGGATRALAARDVGNSPT